MTRLRVGLLAFAALTVFAASGFAEVRLSIVQKTGDGLSPSTAFAPKYNAALGVPWSGMDYGREDAMLVGVDVTPQQHTALAANLDVIAIPTPLDSTVSAAALSTVRDKIEGMKLPASWVTTANTYRQVVGVVGRVFQLMQRFDGLHARTFFDTGITLNTRINQLTANQRNNLQNAAASLGLDTTFVTGPMTIRTVLRTWAQAMPGFTIMGETF